MEGPCEQGSPYNLDIIGNIARDLTEILADPVPSAAPTLLGHGELVANEPTTTADSFLVTSPAAGQRGQGNAESENVVMVGLHALNSTDVDDVQQELVVLGEAVSAQDEQPSPVGGENVVVVGGHGALEFDSPPRAFDSPLGGFDSPPRGFDSLEVVVVGVHAANEFDSPPRGFDSLQVGVAGQGQGERNPRRGGDVVVLSSSSSDDFQQEAELPVPVEVAGQGEPNSGGGENIAFALNRIDDVQQEELAVPGGVLDIDGRKRPHEEAAKQLEIQSLRERNSNEDLEDVCPICMEPWTNSGEHRIVSLACGHLFGKCCIRHWLRQAASKVRRCPHCNKRAKLDDLRSLYVPRTLAVVDGEAQQLAQEVRALRAKILRLKTEKEQLLQEVHQNKQRNGLVQASASQSLADNAAAVDLIHVAEPHNITAGSEPVQNLGYRSSLFGHFSRQAFDSRGRSAVPSGRQDHLLTGGGSNGYGQVSEAGPNPNSSRAGRMDNCGGSFQLQYVVPVRGGKVFDMDAESHTVVFSNKTEGSGFGLSKMSLLSSREIERIDFPGLGAIRDIRLSPSGIGGTGKCAVVASAGKKLSLISLDSNNIVLTYSVQSPPWSCAWDPSVPNLLYSGLQNGCLLLVDLRQTSSPVAMLNGPSNRPIHTLQIVRGQPSVQANMGIQPVGGREILSASNSGIALWNVDYSVAASESERPQCVISDRELVCISLVYDGSVNAAVASVRRSPSAQTEISLSSSNGPSAGQNSSQPIDVHLNSRPSLAAVGCEEPSHCIFSRIQGSSWSEMNERIRTAESKQPWGMTGAMVGNTCQSLMARTAIISKSTPRSKSLFACGDEGTNSVWLWDMTSHRRTDTLVPHHSPILDVKNVQIQGKDMLGCVSEETFQIYRRI